MKPLFKVTVMVLALFASEGWGGLTAFAEPHPHMCAPYADLKTVVDGRHQTIINLTGEQFQFLRGVSSLDPDTPPGLPYGDKAAWVVRADGTARVIFIDGDKACDGFDLPKELVDMTVSVARGDINHESPADVGPPT